MRFDKVEVIGNIWLHRVADKDIERHRTGIDEGRFIYAQAQQKIYYGTSSDWQVISTRYDVIDSGTRMLMGKFPLPEGWNIVTENNDRLVLISNAGSEVGGTAGSWTITGLDQQGSHNHTTGFGYPRERLGSDNLDNQYTALYQHRHSIAVDGLHSHTFDGTWRPSYVKFCEAEYE